VRQMLPVTLAEGTARDAWTYIYNWPLSGLTWIETGRFL
jgi:hypothetical protein